MNKKIGFTLLIMAILFWSCNSSEKNADSVDASETETATPSEGISMLKEVTDNMLTDAEKADGWMLLFNGENSEGWRGFNKEEFPSDWKVTDAGELHFAASQQAEESPDGGDIIYDKAFSNFHLKLEWKISEGGNSGIFYLGQETEDRIWKTAPEMQILDNVNHPDAEKGTDGNRKAGSLYDIYAASPQNANPAGEWNTAEVIVENGKVQHIQNNEVVVEYEIGSEQFKADVTASKFPALNEDWVNIASSGYFGLQDHSDDVWFKNIKIKEL